MFQTEGGREREAQRRARQAAAKQEVVVVAEEGPNTVLAWGEQELVIPTFSHATEDNELYGAIKNELDGGMAVPKARGRPKGG